MSSEINHPTISEGGIIRPTRVEVDLKILADNFNSVKNHVKDVKVMPILKANAYGHGLLRTAQFFQQLKADYLGVAVVEEGILLRENGINIPILVLGGVWGNQVPLFLKHNLNAQAIAALQHEIVVISVDISLLIEIMEQTIKEANQFVCALIEQPAS